MITNLYAKYLFADRLNKVAGTAGLSVAFITVDDGNEYVYTRDVHLQITESATADTVSRLLTQLPELKPVFSDSLLHLVGVSRAGLTFDYYLGRASQESADEIRELVSA